jgi:hypothetical protein
MAACVAEQVPERPGCVNVMDFHAGILSCPHHALPPQWEHTPLISITGDLGVKPAERAAAWSFEATSADDASPTVPH